MSKNKRGPRPTRDTSARAMLDERTATAPTAAAQPAHEGAAFGVPADTPQDTPAPDVAGFDPRAWARGTALVTRSVAVCGRPDLMGQIESLKDELERVQAAEFDDERPLAKSTAQALAETLETYRREMLAAMVTFTFRGLRPGELEKIRKDHGQDVEEGITDLDYKIWGAQCVRVTPAAGEPVKGVDWEVLKLMHVGDPDDDVEGLGNYFMQTIARTANAAAQGGGVDVPFSSASSALTATSSRS